MGRARWFHIHLVGQDAIEVRIGAQCGPDLTVFRGEPHHHAAGILVGRIHSEGGLGHKATLASRQSIVVIILLESANQSVPYAGA